MFFRSLSTPPIASELFLTPDGTHWGRPYYIRHVVIAVKCIGRLGDKGESYWHAWEREIGGTGYPSRSLGTVPTKKEAIALIELWNKEKHRSLGNSETRLMLGEQEQWRKATRVLVGANPVLFTQVRNFG